MQAQQDALQRLSTSTAFGSFDVVQLAREITGIAASTVGVERANVWLFNQGETELRCIDLYEATPRRHSAGMVLSEADYVNEFAALRDVSYVAADEPLSDPRTAGYVPGYIAPLRISSMLDALIQFAGQRIGLLCLEHVDKPHHWETDEIDFACQLADKLALVAINSSRKASLNLLRTVLETVPARIFWKDRDLHYLGCNAAFALSAGFESPSDLIGRSDFDMVWRDRAEVYQADELTVLQSGSPSLDNEELQTTPGGQTIWLSTSKVPTRDARNEVSGILGICHDVTLRRLKDDALKESLSEKESLLKEIHHRVKNNLQVINSLLRLESGRSKEPAVRVALGEMQGRVRSMAVLHETLYRTRTFGRVDLAAYLKEVAQQLFRAQAAGAAAVRLTLDLSPVEVRIDQGIPCGLILNELMTNSFKYAFANGREGELRIALRRDADREVLLEVSDTGAGLPEDFETKQAKSLGMQLVADLTRQIGGRLSVGKGPGANFGITFAALTGERARPKTLRAPV